MSRFTQIDPKLSKLSNKLRAKLTIDRDWDPTANFEERRIDWIENDIHKAIIIQPTFESTGVNQKLWNLIAIAWSNDLQSGFHPTSKKMVIEQENFEQIENNIDRSLEISTEFLSEITKEHLRLPERKEHNN